MTASRKTSAKSEDGFHAVLPLRDIVVFPNMIVPLFVGREKSIKALEEVMGADKQIMLVTQMNATDDEPASDAIYKVGTLANVLQLLKLPDGTVKVLVEGQTRAEIIAYTDRPDFHEAEVRVLSEPEEDRVEIEALSRSVVADFENYVKLNKKVSPEVVAATAQIEDYSKLADTVASHLAIKIPEKQEMLATLSVKGGLRWRWASWKASSACCRWKEDPWPREAPDGEDPARILSQRADEGDPARTGQRRAMAATRLPNLRSQDRQASSCRKEASDKANAELKKLKRMQPDVAEATVVRNYLDVLLGLPWGKKRKLKRTLPRRRKCSTPITMRSTRSRTGSSNISRCRRAPTS